MALGTTLPAWPALVFAYLEPGKHPDLNCHDIARQTQSARQIPY